MVSTHAWTAIVQESARTAWLCRSCVGGGGDQTGSSSSRASTVCEMLSEKPNWMLVFTESSHRMFSLTFAVFPGAWCSSRVSSHLSRNKYDTQRSSISISRSLSSIIKQAVRRKQNLQHVCSPHYCSEGGNLFFHEGRTLAATFNTWEKKKIWFPFNDN